MWSKDGDSKEGEAQQVYLWVQRSFIFFLNASYLQKIFLSKYSLFISNVKNGLVSVNSENKMVKISKRFCLQIVMNSKRLVSHFAWNHQYFENIAKQLNFRDAPEHFTHRFMNIAPSSGEPLPSLDLPIKWILRRFEVVFWCLEWEYCTFQKIDENSFKSTNTILWHFWTYIRDEWVYCTETISSMLIPNLIPSHASLCRMRIGRG